MVASLDGVVFDQVYGDNSGGAEFDSDGDGTTTQEDEFVSFTNTSGGKIDISGWQVWSDATGSGSPDIPVDGLYHTFSPGTVLAPGDTLYVINEITGKAPGWAQEATSGGTESGAGGVSTNFLTEGGINGESIALVNPSTGEYIVFNMDDQAPDVQSLPGFPGKINLGTVDGHSLASDLPAGTSYQYNAATDSYVTGAVFVACFGAGTLIETPAGARAVETIKPGDLVRTAASGWQPLRLRIDRRVRFDTPTAEAERPILLPAGALGPGRPDRPLILSPKHRLLATVGGRSKLVAAKSLVGQRGVRVMYGKRSVRYCHLVLDTHELLFCHGILAESFHGGAYAQRHMHPKLRLVLRHIRHEGSTQPLHIATASAA